MVVFFAWKLMKLWHAIALLPQEVQVVLRTPEARASVLACCVQWIFFCFMIQRRLWQHILSMLLWLSLKPKFSSYLTNCTFNLVSNGSLSARVAATHTYHFLPGETHQSAICILFAEASHDEQNKVGARVCHAARKRTDESADGKRNNVCGDGEPDAVWQRDTNPFSVCPTVTSTAALVSDTLLLVCGSKSCQMLLISESLIETQHAGKTRIIRRNSISSSLVWKLLLYICKNLLETLSWYFLHLELIKSHICWLKILLIEINKNKIIFLQPKGLVALVPLCIPPPLCLLLLHFADAAPRWPRQGDLNLI